MFKKTIQKKSKRTISKFKKYEISKSSRNQLKGGSDIITEEVIEI